MKNTDSQEIKTINNKSFKTVRRICALPIMGYVLLFAAITAIYMLVRLMEAEGNLRIIQTVMIVMIWILGMFLLYKKSSRKKAQETLDSECLLCGGLTFRELYVVIILAGFIMRIGYMLYTGCNVRSHDMWSFSANDSGHAGYILNLTENGQLPETNVRQLYQQPFFYILGSLISKIVNGLLGGSDPYYLVDACKIVSCFASCGVLMITDRICRICRLGQRAHLTAMSLVAFMPCFYLVGARVNCDSLVAFLVLLALLYTFYWYKEPSWKNTVLLAVIYGCAVMTKISCGVMAVFTAAVFLYKLIGKIKKKHVQKGDVAVVGEATGASSKNTVCGLMTKLAVFACISLPLGLWYSVRNYILFGQPLAYVLEIPKDSEIYTGNFSAFSRFCCVDIKNLFQAPYPDVWNDYNMPVYYLKSSLFGEFKFSIMGWIPTLLLFAALIIAIINIAALGSQIVCSVRKCRYKGKFRIEDKSGATMAAVLVLYGVSMLVFNWRYPFGCSMDFRYIVFLTVPAAVLIGKYYDRGMPPLLKTAVIPATVCYGILSSLMYLLIG